MTFVLEQIFFREMALGLEEGGGGSRVEREIVNKIITDVFVEGIRDSINRCLVRGKDIMRVSCRMSFGHFKYIPRDQGVV